MAATSGSGTFDIEEPCDIVLDHSDMPDRNENEHISSTWTVGGCVETSECGAALTYTHSTLESWLAFDEPSKTFTSTFPTPEGTYNVDFDCTMETTTVSKRQVINVADNDLVAVSCTNQAMTTHSGVAQDTTISWHYPNVPTTPANVNFNAVEQG